MLLPLALLVEGPPPSLNLTNAAGYAWRSLAGTGLAYTLWFRGIDRLPVSALTFLGLLSPLVATLLGWAVLEQGLTAVQLAGVVLIVAAVILPQLGRRQATTGRAWPAAPVPDPSPTSGPTTRTVAGRRDPSPARVR